MASAKLAKSTVNHSHSEMARMKPGGRLAVPGDQRVKEEQRGERAADLDHEHDRVLDHAARVELAERVDDSASLTIGRSKRGGS